MTILPESTIGSIDCRLDQLEKSIAELRRNAWERSPASYLEFHHISDYRTHSSLSIDERWSNIRLFERIVRDLKELYYIGNGDMLCRALGRYWMFFSGQDGYVAQHIMANGYWELSCTELVASEVKSGMRVVDAGANIGYFSVLMGDKIGPDGFMYLFEPTPSLKKNLEKTLFLNGIHARCKLVTDPLWDTVGSEVVFSIPIGDTKNATLTSGSVDSNERVTLQTTTMDAVVPSGQQINFMKIDIEGAEHHMWRGMRRVLSDSPDITIFLEFNAGRLQEPAFFIDEIIEAGFELKFLDPIIGATSLSKEKLLSEQFGEDWMLILKR